MGAYFGVTVEELGALPEAACSGGFEKIWRCWQGFLSREIEHVEADYAAEKAAAESGPQDDDAFAANSSKWVCARRALSEQRAKDIEELQALRVAAPPMWRIISGLDENERLMSPGARASGMRRLLKGVERIARTEMRAEESRRRGDWRKAPAAAVSSADAAAADITDIEERRCYAWDPLRSITFYLGIARTKLGAYAWELWGLSATQLIDRVKCEGVRSKIRDEMRGFAREFLATFEGSDEEAVAAAWKAFRASRGGVAYRTSLAAKYGFSSYAKFSRACLMCFGEEPSVVELAELEEAVLSVLTEPAATTTPSAEVEREGIQNSDGEIQNGEAGGVGVNERDGTEGD